jgi:hypothetical protein
LGKMKNNLEKGDEVIWKGNSEIEETHKNM